MTGKRFIYKIKNGAMVIIDKKDNVLIRDKYRACDYLNQLNNENEQLKSTVEEMIKIFNDSGLDYVLSDELEEMQE